MKFEVKIPQVGESISEVTIGQWLKADGEYVQIDEVLCEIESEKATLEIRSEKEGILKIVEKEGETVSIGHKIAEIDTTAQKPDQLPNEEQKGRPVQVINKEVESAMPAKKQIKVSPVAAKLLQESGISIQQIEGTGAGGRITKADVQQVIEGVKKSEVSEKNRVSTEKVKPRDSDVAEKVKQVIKTAQIPTDDRQERHEKMSTLRQTIARRLVAAKNETAMLTTFNELDMSSIMEIRSMYKMHFQEKYGIKLGLMSFFVKACCIALREFPQVNAMVSEDEVIYHDYCDISIAVSTPKGLVVPVIFNADRLSLAQIEAEVDRLATKARDNKLTIEEMTGGTFSITNGGVFGSLLSTPIINAPQTAILGMHKIEERAVVINGEIVIRPMMYVALSYDHRIIDGKESVNFLVRVKELLEDPARMLLDV